MQPPFKKALIQSLALHLVCFLILTLTPRSIFQPKVKVVWIDLPKGSSEELEIKMKEAKNLPQSTIQEQKEWLKEKEAEKKKETKTTSPPKEKLRAIQPEAKPKKPDLIRKALAALEKKTKSAPPEAAQVKDQGEGSKYGTSNNPLRVPPTDPEYVLYQAKVRTKIINEWILPSAYLEGPEKPKASMVVQINQQGEIISIEWENRSGNPSFDTSCQRAIQRATPLPIPPERLQWEAYNEGFLVEFDPSLKQQ